LNLAVHVPSHRNKGGKPSAEGDSGNKKEEIKDSNTKFPLHLNASTALGECRGIELVP
jgi:hypothetical protein